MNVRIFVACACILVCTGGAAFGQIMSHNIRVLSPAQQASINKQFQLAQDANAEMEAGQFATAETDARQSLALGGIPDQVAGLALAGSLTAQHKDKEALGVFAKLTSSDYWLPQGLLPYSLLLLKHGQWPEALSVYKRAIVHVGNGGFSNEGHLLVDDGDFSADTPQPVALETDIHIAMGFFRVDDLGRFGTATYHPWLAEFQEARKLSPDSPLANLAYAKGLRDVGRDAEGRAALEDVASKYTGDIRAEAQGQLKIYYPHKTTAPKTSP